MRSTFKVVKATWNLAPAFTPHAWTAEMTQTTAAATRVGWGTGATRER